MTKEPPYYKVQVNTDNGWRALHVRCASEGYSPCFTSLEQAREARLRAIDDYTPPHDLRIVRVTHEVVE